MPNPRVAMLSRKQQRRAPLFSKTSDQRVSRDIWRMADKSWGAETERNGVGVALRHVSLRRAIWHVLVVRRPDEYATANLVAPMNGAGFPVVSDDHKATPQRANARGHGTQESES